MVNDSSVFIRNAMPSFAFLVEYLFLTSVAFFPSIASIDYCSQPILKIITSNNLGNALIIALLAGGFGNLLSMIHHTFYSKCNRYPKVDHSEFLLEMIKSNKIVIKGLSNTRVGIDAIHFSKSWFLVNCIWHRLAATKPELLNMNKPVDRLSNTLHSVGALFIGIFFAIFFSFITILISYAKGMIIFKNLDCIYISLSLIFAIILFFLHWISFNRVIENVKNLVEATLSTTLPDKFKVTLSQSVLKDMLS